MVAAGGAGGAYFEPNDLCFTPAANFQLVIDSLAWLTDDAATAGTVESEEDVKLEHTREGQGWMFYGTAAAMPVAFLLLGVGRISLRRRRSAA